MDIKDVKILEKIILYRGFFSLNKYLLKHKLFAGGWSESITREVLNHPPAVGALLYDPILDEVVMTEQFRAGALTDKKSPWLIEVVAGLVDEGEVIEQVVKREINEETGLTASALLPITEYWSSPGGSDQYIHLFYAQVDASHAGGIHGLKDEHEDIRVISMTSQQAFTLVQQGQINNSMAIIALQWLQLNLERIRAS